MVLINDANDKFKEKQAKICDCLFSLLQQLNALENEIAARDDALASKRPELGLALNQIVPGQLALWDEYRQRLGDIVKPACTEKLVGRGYGGSFGTPAKYGYLDGVCTVNFFMNSAKRAVVETHFVQGIGQKHKFVMRDMDGKWLIDAVYYGFESDDKWHCDHIH